MKNSIGWVVAVLLGVAVIYRECSPQPEPVDSVVNNYYFDTTEHVSSNYITTKPVVISQPVILPTMDSLQMAEIVRAYLSTYFQRDTVTDDSLSVVVSDSITQNRVFHRKLSYKFRFPILKETIITKTPEIRPKFLIGATIGVGTDVSMSPTFALITRKGNAFTLGTDLLAGERNVSFGYLVKIRFRKK